MSHSTPTTMAGNGPPPDAAASLYVGTVMHARLKPLGHRFTYRVANLLIDIDRLAEAGGSARLFSIGRLNLYTFEPADHLPAVRPPNGGECLRDRVDHLLTEAGLERPQRVVLLCYPRVLGFVFNPISVYFAYRPDGSVSAVIYEVRNTFGEGHSYVAPVEPGDLSPAGLRQTRAKLFYVSPFIDMDQRYHFRLLPPGDAVRVRILEVDGDGPTLSATFSGERRPLTSASLLKLFAAMPAHTLKVVAGIHWEALKLWFKGAPYFARGEPPPAFSLRDGALPDGGPSR